LIFESPRNLTSRDYETVFFPDETNTPAQPNQHYLDDQNSILDPPLYIVNTSVSHIPDNSSVSLTMPVSSRKPAPAQSSTIRLFTSAAAAQSTVHPRYSLPESRDPSPAPPYAHLQGSQVSDHVPADPFRDSRNLAYGPSGPSFPSTPVYQQFQHISPPSNGVNAPSLNLTGPSSSELGPPPRLPFFEAALARSRGEPPPENDNAFASPPQPSFRQPLPVYLPPPDSNHPDLTVGFTQSSTVRFASEKNARFHRDKSRSPSPIDDSFNDGYGDEYADDAVKDVEKALMSEQEVWRSGNKSTHQVVGERGWSEKLSSLGLMGAVDEIDQPLPPFGVTRLPVSGLPAIHIRGHTTSTTDSRSLSVVEGELGVSATQHFGPAPSGRVCRRTHNAAGHRRIKQTATLDENGFFAVDMPIPTRLAQFLPVKGVEEQKSTR